LSVGFVSSAERKFLAIWTNNQSQNTPSAPKKGQYRRSRRQFIDEMNHDGYNLSRPNWSDADRGPTAPYRPGPVYRHSLKTPHHRQKLIID
jgi:hypothetical protein